MKKGRVSKPAAGSGEKRDASFSSAKTSKSVVLQLAAEAEADHPAFDTNLFEYSPEITVPNAYTEDCMFSSSLHELAASREGAAACGGSNACFPAEVARADGARCEDVDNEDCVTEASMDMSISPLAEEGNDVYAHKVVDILKEFEVKTDGGEWPSTTGTACFWCCHGFKGVPIGLPIKYSGEKMLVTGCFCGIPCAAAYNQYSNESINVKVTRHNMLTALSMRLDHGEEVVVAPPRTLLKMFGGHMSIEEFRGACRTRAVYLQSMPPMSYRTAQIEEVNQESISCGFKEKVVPLDTERVERGMQLRRTKPLMDYKNTLDHSMNLTIKQTSSQTDQ